ncbi:DUF4166 domain-containing protein [Andreprevotia chitinilytica]|uniref:DUF4166 domain-containing protein n=1 Tax=Andreprevotia chitinilytica TaxID=396808 RepID=UPI0005536118|nr:DUF4166 domain-containing protein [Andreprevotia chitinilytica]
MAALYESVLGSDFGRLLPLLQRLHRNHDLLWQGEADIQWGHHPLLRALLKLGGLPREGRGVPCSVRLSADGTRECWQRNFAGRAMVSWQHADQAMLFESFGPFRLRLTNRLVSGRLVQRSVATRFLGLPLPKRFGLRVRAHEQVRDGQMRFDVSIGLACGLRLIRYRGWLVAQ